MFVLFQDNSDVKTRFVKIHAPWHLLTKYAEILAVKMPVRVSLSLEDK